MISSLIVSKAIDLSIELNKIVHIPADKAMHSELFFVCAGCTENGDVTEYWGDDWRVHAHPADWEG